MRDMRRARRDATLPQRDVAARRYFCPHPWLIFAVLLIIFARLSPIPHACHARRRTHRRRTYVRRTGAMRRRVTRCLEFVATPCRDVAMPPAQPAQRRATAKRARACDDVRADVTNTPCGAASADARRCPAADVCAKIAARGPRHDARLARC